MDVGTRPADHVLDVLSTLEGSPDRLEVSRVRTGHCSELTVPHPHALAPCARQAWVEGRLQPVSPLSGLQPSPVLPPPGGPSPLPLLLLLETHGLRRRVYWRLHRTRRRRWSRTTPAPGSRPTPPTPSSRRSSCPRGARSADPRPNCDLRLGPLPGGEKPSEARRAEPACRRQALVLPRPRAICVWAFGRPCSPWCVPASTPTPCPAALFIFRNAFRRAASKVLYLGPDTAPVLMGVNASRSRSLSLPDAAPSATRRPELTVGQFQMILDGIDLSRVKRFKRFSPG